MVPRLIRRDEPTSSLLGFEALGLGISGEESAASWCRLALERILHLLGMGTSNEKRAAWGRQYVRVVTTCN